MPRLKSNTVEYFSHDSNASSKPTIRILESKYGIAGYGFWFKLLERLSATENHFLDFSKDIKIMEFSAYALTDFKTTVEILDLLAFLQAITPFLWVDYRIVWVKNLVTRLESVYKNRRRELPQEPIITGKNKVSTCRNATQDKDNYNDNPVESTQSKVKYSKVKYILQNPKNPDFAPKNEKKEENTEITEAIKVFREVFSRFPSKIQMSEITQRVGNNGNLSNWRYCLKEWALHGNKPTNVSGMLDWYEKGIPDWKNKKKYDKKEISEREKQSEKYLAESEEAAKVLLNGEIENETFGT